MEVLGVVTARGGSKGIPRKNLAPLCGKPLLAWTIEAALPSSLARVVLSTDCPEIAAAGEKMGAEILWRPAALATDEAKSIDVLRHAIREYPGFDAVFCLQPTNPLRRTEDIDGAIRLMEDGGCDSVVGMTDVGERHPARMFALCCGEPVMLDASNGWSRRQDLPPRYLRDGSVYLTRTELIERGDMLGANRRAWIVPRERAWAVDEPLDLLIVEALMRGGGCRQLTSTMAP